MNPIIYWSVVTAGSAYAALRDPGTWLFLVVVATAGYIRSSWVALPIIITVATGLKVTILYPYWPQIGIPDHVWSHALAMAWTWLFLALPIFAIARSIGRWRLDKGSHSMAVDR